MECEEAGCDASPQLTTHILSTQIIYRWKYSLRGQHSASEARGEEVMAKGPNVVFFCFFFLCFVSYFLAPMHPVFLVLSYRILFLATHLLAGASSVRHNICDCDCFGAESDRKLGLLGGGVEARSC